MDKLRELLELLEERLEQHDNNRKEVQNGLQDARTRLEEDADLVWGRIGKEISTDSDKRENQIFELINKLSEGEGEISDLDAIMKQAEEVLLKEWRYEIQHPNPAQKSLADSCVLKIVPVEAETKLDFSDTESIENKLEEHFEKIHDSATAAQDRLDEICDKRKKEARKLEERINGKLEGLFNQEDKRVQSVVKVVKENIGSEDPEKVEELTRMVQLTLLKKQSYSLVEGDSLDSYGLEVVREASLKHINFEERKPTDFVPFLTKKGELGVSFTFFNGGEIKVLNDLGSSFKVDVKMWEKGREERTSRTFTKALTLGSNDLTFFGSAFTASTTYCLKMRIVRQETSTQWSDEAEFTTPEFKEFCVWKECPDYVWNDRKYSVDERNPRTVTKNGNNFGMCTAIGSTLLTLSKVTSWSIKILKSKGNDGRNIIIGVAPFDINQNEENNHTKCGWYFSFYSSKLVSGPPHNYKWKEYGPTKGGEQYVHEGDSVGVVMDTTKGELSFVVNGVDLSVAYEGIPLDKPLVPCVLLWDEDDSVELDTSEVKETVVDSSIPVPSNITLKSGITWDSITLTWAAVEGASFYQIEVNGSKFWGASTTNSFTKRGLLPETEHTFRVRTVKGSSVGEWSDVVKRRTEKESFETSGWKECPDNANLGMKYFINEKNPRTVTKNGNNYGMCTIIGNTPLPRNAVTLWSIKVLKSKNNDGGDIYIGVAPSGINQNENRNYNKCGWYFNCYDSKLYSGPPHNYGIRGKEYGSRKGKGQYVHTGDSVCVVMDTTKGELSFVVNGVNLGVAYEGIPLDKPLVPCVIQRYGGDSVELVIYNQDSSVPVPSNVIPKSDRWYSISLTWDAVEGASFYQVEVDRSKSLESSTTNSFTKRGLLPETEHTFRIRTVKGNSLSEWSYIVKGRTQKETFETSVWKECPDNVNESSEYSVDVKNPRIATKVVYNFCFYCTIIGDTPLPPNKVTSWSIKILKSKNNDGRSIFIGVAPFDIDQYENDNYNKCGWYFHCYDSQLCSGPPHNYNYRGKEYGPWKEWGKYVRTGDSIGVVMDTTKGELSFVVNGVNYGVAYEGIPLDKPLVPCVILEKGGDSVELII